MTHLRAFIPLAFTALAASIYSMIIGTEGFTLPMLAVGTTILFVPFFLAFAAIWGVARLLRVARAMGEGA